MCLLESWVAGPPKDQRPKQNTKTKKQTNKISNKLPQVILWPLHVHPPTYKIKDWMKKLKEKWKEESPLLSLVSSPAMSQQKGPDAEILYTEGQVCNTMPPLAEPPAFCWDSCTSALFYPFKPPDQVLTSCIPHCSNYNTWEGKTSLNALSSSRVILVSIQG